MSVVGLGDRAVVGELDADEVQYARERLTFGDKSETAGALAVVGVQFIKPPANPTAYTLGDGVDVGDVVHFIHEGGGNVANISAPKLHGAAVSAALGGGASLRCVWSGTEWYVIGRDSSAVAAGGVVAGLPDLA